MGHDAWARPWPRGSHKPTAGMHDPRGIEAFCCRRGDTNDSPTAATAARAESSRTHPWWSCVVSTSSNQLSVRARAFRVAFDLVRELVRVLPLDHLHADLKRDVVQL